MPGLLATAVLLTVGALVLPWLWDNVVVVGRRLWATRAIPEPPGGSLWLGHIPVLVRSTFRTFRCFHQWSLSWPVYKIRFFWRPVVVVTDPEVYQPLMRQGPAKLPKYTPPYRMFELFTKPERANILTSPENATWKAVRQAAVAALTMNNLRLCFPHITGVTQRLIDTLAAAGPSAVHDMDAVAAAITVDVIGLAAFNRDLQATCTMPPAPHSAPTPQQSSAGPDGSSSSSSSAADHADVGYAGDGAGAGGICGSVVFPRGREVLRVISHLVVAMQARNNPLNRWFPWRQAHRDLFYWGGRMSALVEDLTSSMEQTPPPAHSLGAHLLKAQYSDGQPLPREQIMAEIGIMWGAGFETTAHTICWTLFLLSTHPEAEARLCAELDGLGLLATPGRPQPAALQWEHLSQLKYLSAVINESMRMYPAASSGTIRVTQRPITLAGNDLPAGQPVMIPMWAIHRSPRLWQDPDTFRPERFMAAGAAAAGANGATPSGVVDPPTAPAAVSASSTVLRADAGGEGSGCEDDDDYVDVAADLAADVAAARDQDQQGSKQGPLSSKANTTTTGGSSSSSSSSNATDTPAERAAAGAKVAPVLELKDPTVDRRGFLPFSIGSRNCVGQALALVELKAVLALLVGTFSFTLHPSMGGFEGVDASAKQTITLRPEHGLLMTLTPRVGAAPKSNE